MIKKIMISAMLFSMILLFPLSLSAKEIRHTAAPKFGLVVKSAPAPEKADAIQDEIIMHKEAPVIVENMPDPSPAATRENREQPENAPADAKVNSLIAESANNYQNVPETYFAIQTGSFLIYSNANDQFDAIVRDFKKKDIEDLRIVKIGKFYAVRFGQYDDRKAAEKILWANQPQLSHAIILKTNKSNLRNIKRSGYAAE